MTTWDSVAAAYDARRCPGCPYGDHRKGWVVGRVVHWSDRRMTRAGLRRYLTLVATTRLLGVWSLPPWDRIYRVNTWAAQAARDLHIRIPSRLSDTDRATVRWLTRDITQQLPAPVRRWARRITP